MKKKKIFRQVSLERLSSPERLDEVMTITEPRGWLALTAIFLLLAAAVVWSLFGIMAEKVSGRGILVRSGGVLEIVANTNGRVNDMPLSVGDNVTEGQVVAWIAQPEVLERFQEARNDLLARREDQEQKIRFARDDATLQRRSLDQRRSSLERSMAADRERLEALQRRIDAQKELLDEGLIAGPDLMQSQQQYDQTEEKIRLGENSLAQIEIEELQLENRLKETIRSGDTSIAEAEARLAQIQRELDLNTQVTSPYTGRILELMTEPGQIVRRGEPILSLDLTGKAIQNLIAIMYVPSVHGKKIKPGMEIQIAPSTVRQEEFGLLLGRVTFASSFPATPKGMSRVLKNEQLVGSLSDEGAPYEVHAELIVDPNTPSQYRWTSSAGPPTKIQSGTVAVGYITVNEQRPISRVLPIFRKLANT